MCKTDSKPIGQMVILRIRIYPFVVAYEYVLDTPFKSGLKKWIIGYWSVSFAIEVTVVIFLLMIVICGIRSRFLIFKNL